MEPSCWSLFFSLYSKPLITLPINLVGKSAFLNLFLIIFPSLVKSVLIRLDLWKSPILTLRLYFLGILDFQGVGNLVSLRWTDNLNRYHYEILSWCLKAFLGLVLMLT